MNFVSLLAQTLNLIGLNIGSWIGMTGPKLYSQVKMNLYLRIFGNGLKSVEACKLNLTRHEVYNSLPVVSCTWPGMGL